MPTRSASENPDVHRDLVVSDPPQEGRDVANFQRAIKERLKARGLSDDVRVPQHGKFTHATWVAAIEAGYFLGLRSETYLKTEKGHGVSTQGAQQIIRHPDERTELQLTRAREREDQLKRGPRYYEEMVKKEGKGAQAAVNWATNQIGTRESPAGSNWGPDIGRWIRATGYNTPVPWCGCFVNAALMAAGQPSGAGWIGYTPAIVTRARNKVGGWSWHQEGKAGDLALFDTPGGDPAVHVGLVKRKLGSRVYGTVEGNTSSGQSGSQSEGGGVFARERSMDGNFRIIGFARPPW